RTRPGGFCATGISSYPARSAGLGSWGVTCGAIRCARHRATRLSTSARSLSGSGWAVRRRGGSANGPSGMAAPACAVASGPASSEEAGSGSGASAVGAASPSGSGCGGSASGTVSENGTGSGGSERGSSGRGMGRDTGGAMRDGRGTRPSRVTFHASLAVASVLLVARHPVVGRDGAAERDLAGQDDAGHDLGELVHAPAAGAAEEAE